MQRYDLAIIGAGPGGYVAAIRAAQLGLKVVCIDQRATLGGTCLNIGCIPSKALLESTALYAHFKQAAKEQGIEYADLSVNFTQMVRRKNQVVKSLVDGVDGLFKRHQIPFIQGEASFINPHAIQVVREGQTQDIEADHFILATGSESIPLPNLPFDERQIISSTGALGLSQIPQRMIIIGGGVIGVELASVYSRLGTEVTIIEMLDYICPAMDHTISKWLLRILEKQGIKFLLSTQVLTSIVQPDEVILTINQDQKLSNLSATVVLVSIGRRPYTQGLNLEHIGVQLSSKGFIVVDGVFRTTQPHIFAIGDVIEGTMLAHRASEEGVAIVEFLAGYHPSLNYLAIPNVIYTSPEVAAVGMTEREAQQAGLKIKMGTYFFRGNPRARCSGETEGLVKVIGEERSDRLIGMHIIGVHASELIAEGMIAIQKKATLTDIGQTPHAHPTLSEAIKEAALNALGRPLH